MKNLHDVDIGPYGHGVYAAPVVTVNMTGKEWDDLHTLVGKPKPNKYINEITTSELSATVCEMNRLRKIEQQLKDLLSTLGIDNDLT